MDRLIVQVRGRGDAWYLGGREPRPPQLASDFDPLAEVIRAAQAEGIEVHAWVNILLVASGDDLPADPRHVVRRAPQWLDRHVREANWPESSDLAAKLLRAAGEDPLREGLYLHPYLPEVRADAASICRDIVRRYDVQGLHLDYVRYAGPELGAHPRALKEFGGKGTTAAGLQRREKERAAWREFRAEQVDRLVEEIARAARGARPDLVISAAVRADIAEAERDYGQRWPRWLERGWIDVACPMNYAVDRATFEAQVRAAARLSRIWMGIGAWRLTPEDTKDRVAFIERQNLAEAVILFSQATLREQPALVRSLASSPRSSPRP